MLKFGTGLVMALEFWCLSLELNHGNAHRRRQIWFAIHLNRQMRNHAREIEFFLKKEIESIFTLILAIMHLDLIQNSNNNSA